MLSVLLWFALKPEDLIDRAFKDLPELQSEFQTGHISAALDRVYALTRHAHLGGKPTLRPAALFSEFRKTISDRDHVKWMSR